MTKDEVANMETFMIVEKICSDNYMVWNEHLGFRSAFHLFCVRHHQIRVLLRKLEKLQGFKSFQLELFKFQMVEQTKALASQLRIFAFRAFRAISARLPARSALMPQLWSSCLR